MTQKKLSAGKIFIFSLPTISSVLLIAPLGGVLPAFYATNTTATMTTIGSVLLIARVSDAVTDPVIGILSDRTVSRLGPRKPWLIAGALLSMICAYPLFSPSADVGALHFLIWSSLAYLAWTMVFLPYNAWASELSGDYHERSRVFAYRNLIGGIGGILFATSPLLFSPLTGTTEMNGEALKIVGILVIILMPLCVLIAVTWGPERINVATTDISYTSMLKAISSNRLMWFFMIITVLSGIATGMQTSLAFVVLNHLKLGEYFPYIAVAGMLGSMGTIPVWLKLTQIFGKHKPWAIAMFGQLPVLPVLLLLTPGPQSFVPLLLLTVYISALSSCTLVTAGSMLSDIADYGTLKSGANQSGSYFSFLSFLGKVEVALGGGLGFFIAGAFGFQAGAENNGLAALGLILSYAGVPAVLSVMSGILMWFYPLTAERHRIIRKRLEARVARAENHMEQANA